MNRKIDELGRIVIPKEIRNKLGIHEDDTLEIVVKGKSIILSKSTTDKLYDDFMNLIGKYNNDDLIKLGKSLIEYANEDKEE